MSKCTTCSKECLTSDFHESPNKKGHTAQCKACRSEVYFKNKYGLPCVSCHLFKRLETNSLCRDCNNEVGLRCCIRCREWLPVLVEFYENRNECKACYKGKQVLQTLAKIDQKYGV